jgi:hypothetical protein
MPCDTIIIIKSPSAKSRTKKPCFPRENEASPRKTFFDFKKTSKNTRMYIGEKFPRSAKTSAKRPLFETLQSRSRSKPTIEGKSHQAALRRLEERGGGNRNGRVVQGRRRVGFGALGIRSRLYGHAPGGILLHDRSGHDAQANHRNHHGALVDRNDVSRDALASGIGNDQRSHRADRVERCPVFVWPVQRGGVVVCPTSGQPTQRVCNYMTRQRPRGFFRRNSCRSTLAVDGMGFCDARPKRYLNKTIESVKETTATRPHVSRLAV